MPRKLKMKGWVTMDSKPPTVKSFAADIGNRNRNRVSREQIEWSEGEEVAGIITLRERCRQ